MIRSARPLFMIFIDVSLNVELIPDTDLYLSGVSRPNVAYADPQALANPGVTLRRAYVYSNDRPMS